MQRNKLRHYFKLEISNKILTKVLHEKDALATDLRCFLKILLEPVV